ncbi:sugar transferase [Dermatobacter hominis]|uniref:sugar transferase n=1 Tax=Dermatobacter hominis TaxID=2884263 RepID=UPI001D0F738C|nr:sugar transferase [Dermatobacter hominis]UDY37703.1 sugar transferase [Dermatobacter hominis]
MIDLTDGAVADPIVLNPPASDITRQERRAVGRSLQAMGHLLDAVALLIPLFAFGYFADAVISVRVGILFAIVGTLLLWPTHRRGRQAVAPSEGLLSIITRIGLAPVATSALVTLTRVNDFSNARRFIDVVAIVQLVVFTLPLVLLGRLITSRVTASVRRQGFDLEDTLIVGSGPVGQAVAAALKDNPEFGLVPCGFIDRFDDQDALPLVGHPEHLPAILQLTAVRHVVLAFGAASETELVRIVRRCHDDTVQFYAVPRLFELGVSHEDVGHEVDGLPLVPLRRPGTASHMWPVKRAFDLVAAGLLLLLTAPVFLACAIGVKLTSAGPVFFRQVRIGIGGKPFEILKFRTMKVNDDSAKQWSVDDDDRVTRVGRLLRPTHLDELPQLVNVLKGEMSLVGPRPERPHFVEQFGSEIEDYHERHRVPVGITGWAQVNGFWGDTSIETRVRLDNRYIENWSLWRDLVIGLRTIPTLLGKRR